MSLLVDNPITRFFNGLLGKTRLAALATDELFDFVFPKGNTDRLHKLLYLAGISYLTYRAGKSLYNLYRNWGWVLRHASYARAFNHDEFKNRYQG
jgi:hypothetical protein